MAINKVEFLKKLELFKNFSPHNHSCASCGHKASIGESRRLSNPHHTRHIQIPSWTPPTFMSRFQINTIRTGVALSTTFFVILVAGMAE